MTFGETVGYAALQQGRMRVMAAGTELAWRHDQEELGTV